MKITRTQRNIFIIAIILAVCFLASSCGVSKKIESEKTSVTTQIEKTETVKEDVTDVKISQAIDDSVTTQVQATGDPVLDAKIDAILAGLSTQKSSGSNSYKFYYDEKLRQLRAEFAIGQTKDSIVVSLESSVIEKTFEEQITESYKKVVKMIPWWVYGIVIFLYRKQIFGFVINIVGMFYPPARLITGMKDLFTPPNPPTK